MGKKKKKTGGVREDSNLANRDLEFLIPQSDDSRWGMDHSEDFFFVFFFLDALGILRSGKSLGGALGNGRQEC